MASRGRPRLTEDVLAQRIADYCSRYGVTERNASGFPVFPAGKRETAQHREWVVLFKSRSRLERAGSQDSYMALLAAQAGRCPVCAEELALDDGTIAHGPPETGNQLLVHAPCGTLVRAAVALGPAAVERLRSILWPAGSRTRRPK